MNVKISPTAKSKRVNFGGSNRAPATKIHTQKANKRFGVSFGGSNRSPAVSRHL